MWIKILQKSLFTSYAIVTADKNDESVYNAILSAFFIEKLIKY